MEAGAGDGQVLLYDLAGDAADDMDAEFESLGVNPVGERLESGVVGGSGETRGIGNEDAVLIPEIFAGLEGAAEGVLHVPAFVDDGVLPAELADAGEDGGIGAEVGFADGEAVGVPAVPAHGGGGGRVLGEARRGEPERRARQTSRIKPDRNMWKRIPQPEAESGWSAMAGRLM